MSYKRQNNDLPKVFQRLGNSSRPAFRKHQRNDNEPKGLRIARHNDSNRQEGYPDYSKISQLQDDAVFYSPNNSNNNNSYFSEDTSTYPPRANSFRFVRNDPAIERPIISFLRDSPTLTNFNPQHWPKNEAILDEEDQYYHQQQQQQQQRNFNIAKKIQITTSLPSNASNEDTDAPLNKRKITVTPRETSPAKKKFKPISPPPRTKRRRSLSPSHLSSADVNSSDEEAPFLSLKPDVYTPNYTTSETKDNINNRLSGIKRYKELRACPPLGELDPSAAPRPGSSATMAANYHKAWIKPSDALPPSKKFSPSSSVLASKPVAKKPNVVAAPNCELKKATSVTQKDAVSKSTSLVCAADNLNNSSASSEKDPIPSNPANDRYIWDVIEAKYNNSAPNNEPPKDTISTSPAAKTFTFIRKGSNPATPSVPVKNTTSSESRQSTKFKEATSASTADHKEVSEKSPASAAVVQPAIGSPKFVHASDKSTHISHNTITVPHPTTAHTPLKRTTDDTIKPSISGAGTLPLNEGYSAKNIHPSSTTSVSTTVKHGTKNHGDSILKANPVQNEAKKPANRAIDISEHIITDQLNNATKGQQEKSHEAARRKEEERKAAAKKEAQEAVERVERAKAILRQLKIDERDDVVMDIAPLTRDPSLTNGPTLGSHNNCKKSFSSETLLKEEPMEDCVRLESSKTTVLVVDKGNQFAVNDTFNKTNAPFANVNAEPADVDETIEPFATDIIETAVNQIIDPSVNETIDNAVTEITAKSVNKLIENTITETIESVVSDTIESAVNGAFGLVNGASESVIQKDAPMPDVAKTVERLPAIITEENALNSLLNKPQQLASPPTSSHTEDSPSRLPTIPTKKPETSLSNTKKSPGRLPRPWKTVMTDSGEMYYHNPVTGERSQDRPVA